MSYPDFSEHGYQVLRELGRNREGGRITWLASKVNTGEHVVIKQFCFAQAGSSWSGFRVCKKEIQFLQKLDHPGIPHYLILLTLGFGASVGSGIIASFLNPLVLLALTGTSLPILSMLLYSPLKRRKLISKYRQSEESLIKP
ncbi:hypothetical protein [Nostoc sp.]|uniref:hypothetical protein n=1 Tax=Nostoc sp. TaxID=1180 RepID=UPI002FFC1E15